jgi:hypothetical protein
VAAINRWPQDWFIDSRWDNPENLIFGLHAGHFSSGLSNVQALDKFVTVRQRTRSEGDETGAEYPFDITGEITIEEAGADKAGERTVVLSQQELVLKLLR